MIFIETYQKHQELTNVLNQFMASPFLRTQQANEFQTALAQQNHLALELGSLMIRRFAESTSYDDFLTKLTIEINVSQSQSSIKPEVSADDLTTLNSVAPDCVAPDSAALDSVAPDSVAPDSVAPDSVAPDSVAPDETSSHQSKNHQVIAEHTGRSISLSPEAFVPRPVDYNAWIHKGLQHSFSEGFSDHLPQVNAPAPVVDPRTRIINLIQEMQKPIKIIRSEHINDAFSLIQSLADHSRMKLWPSFDPALIKALCTFIVNYTCYVYHKPMSLRPNGMTGDNSYLKLIIRIQAYINKHSIIGIHTFKDQNTLAYSSWENVSTAYDLLQIEVNKEIKKDEKLNADRQIDLLKKLISKDSNAEEDEGLIHKIIEQVRLILHQTDATHQDVRLVKLLVNYQEELSNDTGFKNLRASIRKYEKQLEDTTINKKTKKVFEKFANKKIVLVGGDRKHDATLYLKSILPNSTHIHWPDMTASNGHNTRRSLVESIRKGGDHGVDAVIIIQRYISHDVSTPLKAALKEHPLCASAMAKGYGKAQLYTALECIMDQWNHS